jgi:branched-chain amino acid transport system substrate-binding protein
MMMKSHPKAASMIGLFLLLASGWVSGCGASKSPISTSNGIDVSDRLSEGQKPFFLQDGTEAKDLAVKAYAEGKYSVAQAKFSESLQQKPNDPESLIYTNNAKAHADNPLKIAVSVPINKDTNAAHEILRGVAQAQAEINQKGGINGRGLIIAIGDDDNDPKIGQQIAASFVSQENILATIGHLASSVTLAAADTYTQGKLVAITPVSSAVQLSNKSPYIFRTVPSDAAAALALADYMAQTLNRKKAVVYFNSESEYSKSLKGEFTTAIALKGGQVVAEYDLSNPIFSPQQSLDAAKLKGAEVIMMASNTDMLDRGWQVIQANKKQLPMLGGDDVYTAKTLDITRAQGEGMVLAVPWHILNAGTGDFVARSRALWRADVNWRTVTAYDATQALIAALAKDARPSRATVQQSLLSPGFSAPGASRDVAFLPSGDRNGPVQLVKIQIGNRSSYGYDFVPLTGSN